MFEAGDCGVILCGQVGRIRDEPALNAAMITWHITEVSPPATADGITTSRVWLTLDGVDFPCARWADLPMSVVGAAVAAYTNLLNGEGEVFSYFFEGSYYLYYRRVDADEPRVYIEANRDDDPDNPVSIAVGEVLLDQFRSALASAVHELANTLQGKPHTEEDMELVKRNQAILAR
ncbi:hypothetical protein AB0M36_04305 [Actinoplanes sp. NPDC051346]|uniref:hypothetical protein n=1 Tax=Actinoplanes sp. NPDC051346 TaxID=3155048 RepID=UPI00342678DB